MKTATKRTRTSQTIPMRPYQARLVTTSFGLSKQRFSLPQEAVCSNTN